MQELVGRKGRTGGATIAAGLNVYARSIGLSLEKYDDVYGACGEALERGPIRFSEDQYEEKTIKKKQTYDTRDHWL